jgi:cardiolipin synthase
LGSFVLVKPITLLRRALLVVFGVPVVVALGLTLVDSYRRRLKGRGLIGRQPRRYPSLPPGESKVGSGTVTTYTRGTDLYEDMLAAIAGAQRQVLLETYIWKGDGVGERFKQALADAAARGVEVYAIYDKFANLVVSPLFKRFPEGVHVLAYPVYSAGWRFFDLRRYGRDHRKILVVDDSAAFVGGYNIGTTYATEWRDTHVRLTGPAVSDLRRSFADFWNLHRHRAPGEPPLLVQASTEWEPRIRVHRNVPRLWVFPIRGMYLDAIQRAQQRIWLTQAYFIPDEDFVTTLKDAARRGVDVRLVVAGKSNHVVADWISRGYFGGMLDAGIRIFRYRDWMVHAKTATIDGTWSTVGTANLDRLSLTGNYEINLEVIDDGVAAEMERIFRTDLENCHELTSAEWDSRDIYRRFTESVVLRPLRSLL